MNNTLSLSNFFCPLMQKANPHSSEKKYFLVKLPQEKYV